MDKIMVKSLCNFFQKLVKLVQIFLTIFHNFFENPFSKKILFRHYFFEKFFLKILFCNYFSKNFQKFQK